MNHHRDRSTLGDCWGRPLNRRAALKLAGLGGFATALTMTGGASANRGLWLPMSAQTTPAAGPAEELTIDLLAEPPSLDPAVVYDVDGWSILHSVYDALVQYGSDGRLQLVLAEAIGLPDPLTYEIKLRQGIAFHNGEPFDARSVAFSLARLGDDATAPQISSFFGPRTIREVEEVDPLTLRLHLAQPAPWLPAQMAAWLVALPPAYAADPNNDFAANPVGTGPYRFDGWERGGQIALRANEDYFAASPKGRPIADAVTYRFVPEASTRVADLLAGTADLVRAVPVDQAEAVADGGAQVVVQPISGSAWVRIPTDVPPFADVRVRQALNHAVDIDVIVDALLGGEGRRLANFFVENGLGYDPHLTPFPYDPDRARELLAEAGLADGFETVIEYASDEREDVVAAVAGQLTEVGIRAEPRPVEKATFNGTWTDPAAAPLRFVTWRPLFDPYTLLNLLVSSEGVLSRHDNPAAQPLIEAGAAETDEARRAEIYRDLGRVLREQPAAIYLFSLTARYGVAEGVPAWTPRPDDYIIPTGSG